MTRTRVQVITVVKNVCRMAFSIDTVYIM